MDMFEYLERVEGNLLWHEYQLDELLNNQAWFTANVMMASGNFKKGTSPLELKKGLYKSLEDLAEENKPKDQIKKDVEAEKAKLMQRFNINPETIK